MSATASLSLGAATVAHVDRSLPADPQVVKNSVFRELLKRTERTPIYGGELERSFNHYTRAQIVSAVAELKAEGKVLVGGPRDDFGRQLLKVPQDARNKAAGKV